MISLQTTRISVLSTITITPLYSTYHDIIVIKYVSNYWLNFIKKYIKNLVFRRINLM